jgi:hypothetical protein
MPFPSEYLHMLQRYAQIRESRTAEYVAYPVVPERLVRCVWYDGLYDTAALRTLDGAPVEVLSQGEWNLHERPDFLDAVVRIGDDAPRHGDVEIHVRSGDWRRHGHGGNDRYNRVVLHVALWHDGPEATIERADGIRVAQVVLLPVIHEDIWDLASRIDMENYPFSSESRVGACHAAASEMPASLNRVLVLAGRERLMAKARRLARELKSHNEDEVLYHGFMEGMGYRPNKRPFRRLADLVPLKTLRPLILATPSDERILVLQSVFLGMSGLADSIQVSLWDEETVEYFRKLKAFWDSEKNPFSGKKRLKQTDFTRTGVRPANFPIRRILGMCELLAATDCLPGRAVHAFREQLRASNNDRDRMSALKELLDALAQAPHGFWRDRMGVGSSRSRKQLPALIGKPLARTITLNTVLPLLICRARRDRDKALLDATLALYDRFPSLDEHQISRLMSYRIHGAVENPPPVRREIVQQGLVQVFFDFCDENVRDCSRCELPRMIRDSAGPVA